MDVTGTFYPGEAILGLGAELMVGQDDGSPETFVAIADVLSIQPGELTNAVFDKTHLRSPDGHREKKVGLSDSGPFTVTGNYRPTHGTHTNTGGDGVDLGLIGLARTKAERNWKIRIPTSPIWELPFRGVVSRFQIGEIGVDDKIGFTAEITPLSSYSSALP